MPQPFQTTLMSGVTTNTNGTGVDVRNFTALSAFASSVGGTSVDLTFQATSDPAGLVGWTTIASRNSGGGAYATTAASITPAAPRNFYFDPTDNIGWVRAVTANQVGPTAITVILNGEQ